MTEVTFEGLEAYVGQLRKKLDDETLSQTDRKMFHEMYMDGYDRLQTTHHSEMEAYDREQRRELEEKKIRLEAEIESLKAKFDWKKAGLEVTKVVIPLAVNSSVYLIALSVTHDIETVGRIVSKLGNATVGHMPRPFK